jgi:hypothetical protein
VPLLASVPFVYLVRTQDYLFTLLALLNFEDLSSDSMVLDVASPSTT